MAEQTVSNEINALEVQAFELPLFQAMRRLQQDAEVHAKRLARYGGLSPVQLMILQVLAGEGQMTASALSRRVSLTAATLSGQLDRLEERGLLQRQRDDQTAAANGCCSATAAGNCCRTHRRCCRRNSAHVSPRCRRGSATR